MTAEQATSEISARPIYIDALNLAYWCGPPPSLRVPLTLLAHLLSIKREAVLYFDASARHRLGDESALYEQLSQHAQYFVEAPSGRTADGLMLKHARAQGACIISRDKFGDHRKRYRKLIDDPTRLMSGYVAEGRLLVTSMGIDVALASSAADGWQRSLSQLPPAA